MAANQRSGRDGSPEHSGSFNPDSSIPNNTSSAKPKRPRSDHLEALAALPEVRPIPWKEGRELPPESSTESTRVQTRSALLMVTRGVSVNPRCGRCQDGIGRFSLCVALPGWFGGSCATCQMSTKANRCSLRAEGAGNAPDSATKEAGMHQAPLDETRDRQPSLKRKRQSASHKPASRPQMVEFSSPESDGGARNAHGNSTNHAATQNSDPVQESAADDNTSLIQYVYQKLNPPNGKKRHHILDQASGEVPESFAPAGRTPTDSNTARRAPPNNREQRVQDTSNSLSPSAQLLSSVQASYTVSHSKRDSAKQSELRDHGSQESALFDALPRKKQKQILGIIGGLQSGIRTAKQQTESLQKQLDLLQTALGIDFDDDDDR